MATMEEQRDASLEVAILETQKVVALRNSLVTLTDIVEAAIKSGDWKVDGACDPSLALDNAKEALRASGYKPSGSRFAVAA